MKVKTAYISVSRFFSCKLIHAPLFAGVRVLEHVMGTRRKLQLPPLIEIQRKISRNS